MHEYKNSLLWDSFTGWSVLMHFYSQTSIKNISPPPQIVPHTGQNTKPCSLKQVSCRKQTLSTSDTAPHTGWHLVCAGRTSETPGVILQKEYLCFCLSLRHNDLPLSRSSAALQPAWPGTELQLPRGGRGWVPSPQRCFPGTHQECLSSAQGDSQDDFLRFSPH